MIVAFNALGVRPGRFDGGATVALNLLRQLPDVLPEGRLVVYARPGETRIQEGDRVEVRRPAVYGSAAGRIALETVRLGRELRSVGADVLVSPHESVPLRLPCRLVVIAQNLVYQCGLATFTGGRGRDRLLTRTQQTYYGIQMARTYARADAVIAVSEHTVDVLERHAGLDRGKTSVTLLGSDSWLLPEIGASVERQPELLAVSTVAPYKNLDAAVSMLARLRRRHPDLRLTIAGGDWRGYRQVLAAATERLGVAASVDFVGPLGPVALTEAYARASLLVHLSSCEACPLPVLEAMRFGLPVVASNRASLPEVAGDAGLVVDPADIGAATAAVDALLDDDARRAAMVERGHERAASLTWRAAAEHVAGVVESVGSASARRVA